MVKRDSDGRRGTRIGALLVGAILVFTLLPVSASAGASWRTLGREVVKTHGMFGGGAGISTTGLKWTQTIRITADHTQGADMAAFVTVNCLDASVDPWEWHFAELEIPSQSPPIVETLTEIGGIAFGDHRWCMFDVFAHITDAHPGRVKLTFEAHK